MTLKCSSLISEAGDMIAPAEWLFAPGAWRTCPTPKLVTVTSFMSRMLQPVRGNRNGPQGGGSGRLPARRARRDRRRHPPITAPPRQPPGHSYRVKVTFSPVRSRTLASARRSPAGPKSEIMPDAERPAAGPAPGAPGQSGGWSLPRAALAEAPPPPTAWRAHRCLLRRARQRWLNKAAE